MHAHIWGKIAFYTHDSNQDQVSVHSDPDNNGVSDFRTREEKQCHAFVRQRWDINVRHLMPGSQHGLPEIELLPMLEA